MKEPILYRIVSPIIKIIFNFIFKPTYIGLENISKEEKIINNKKLIKIQTIVHKMLTSFSIVVIMSLNITNIKSGGKHDNR